MLEILQESENTLFCGISLHWTELVYREVYEVEDETHEEVSQRCVDLC